MRGRANSTEVDYFVGVLSAVCELMCGRGISKTSAEQCVKEALDQGYSDSTSASKGPRPFSTLADVCARWHWDKDFVDSVGSPKPLSWNGRTGDLLRLVNRVVGRRDARAIADELVLRHLLRKSDGGMWLPKSKVVAPYGSYQAEILRTASMVQRLLRTVLHNRALGYRGGVLLEVMAQVPRLPTRHTRSFKKFTKDQGISFIKTVDDWLESRNLHRAGPASEAPTTEAGVVAFAYLQPRRRKDPKVTRS
jgi:hypothetical protein